jgi:hypothetical protein
VLVFSLVRFVVPQSPQPFLMPARLLVLALHRFAKKMYPIGLRSSMALALHTPFVFICIAMNSQIDSLTPRPLTIEANIPL